MLNRLVAGALALAVPFAVPAVGLAQEKVLKAVMHADVRVIDPIWTTQTIANIHGMLVYDTLFGNDADLKPHPQMVGKYEISPDKLVYTFTLRDGLKFHDGSPVTSNDVIPSLRRWAARDGVGGRLFSFVEKLEAVDAKTFRMTLNKPYGMVLESLGKTNSSVPVIMRAQDAATDPQQQVKEAIGSGPFRFAKEQWVPGSKAIYLKNADYVPRPGNEPATAFAGSKFPGVDRLELIWIPDSQTAMQALIAGEIDYFEAPNIDFLPILARARGVKLQKTGKLDSTLGMIRLNHLHPPFNNPKARQAMYHLIKQEDFLRAVVGNPEYYKECHSFFTCGSPLTHPTGIPMLKDYNPKKALQLMKEAGYNGEPITVLQATDHVTITPATQVLIQAMRDAGLNVDAQAMDWGSVVSRRTKKEPPAQGGWNIFVTGTGGVGSSNPVLHTWLGGTCDKALTGWPCDAKIEELRNAYAFAQTDAEKQAAARAVDERAAEVVTYIPFGQWSVPIAYRQDRIENVVTNTGLAVLWNIRRK